MKIIKDKESGYLTPIHNVDLPVFEHCTQGHCAITEKFYNEKYKGIFILHGISICIEEEQ